jgi:hypothetical protein
MTEEKFKHVAMGSNSVWAVGEADGTVFRLFGDAGMLGWVPDKAGKAEVIAPVDWGNAWCVNKKHEIWHLTDAENLSEGGTWTKVPTYSGKKDAMTIAVGQDGSVWYAQTDGKIFHQSQPSNGKPGGWIQEKGAGNKKVAVMAVSPQGGVWCVTQKGNIRLWQNGAWIQIATQSGRADAKTLTVNNKGRVWYISADGDIFVSTIPGDGVSLPPWMHDTSWDQKRMGRAKVISAFAGQEVYCLNKKGDIWRSYDGKWSQVKSGPVGNEWRYTVKKGDGLMAIVRQEFDLKDPKDTKEIDRLVNLIVAQNSIANKNKINPGDVLTLQN